MSIQKKRLLQRQRAAERRKAKRETRNESYKILRYYGDIENDIWICKSCGFRGKIYEADCQECKPGCSVHLGHHHMAPNGQVCYGKLEMNAI